MLITQFLAYLFMLILCHNIKYRRFVPQRFGFLMAIIYSIFLFAVVYISVFIDNDLNIVYYCTMFIAFLAVMIYLVDIASFFFEKIIFIYGISFIFSTALIILDMFVFVNAWFFNDIIALLTVGALIKFIVIKKIKSAILPLTFLWIFFVFRQFAIELHI